MSFFIRQNGFRNQSKRKVTNLNSIKIGKESEEHVSSDSDDEIAAPVASASDSESDNELTAQEERVRQAKAFLKTVENDVATRDDNEADPNTSVANKLRSAYLESIGKLFKATADQIESLDLANKISWALPKRGVITAAAVSVDCDFVYIGTKNGQLLIYSVKKKLKVIQKSLYQAGPKGYKSTIRALALAYGNKYLAVGQGCSIFIKDPARLNTIHTFNGHKSPITALTFRRGSYELYSASEDRSLKLWQVDSDHMAYLETLYGHQAGVVALDALSGEFAVTAGGYDATLRFWEMHTDVQSIFYSANQTTDCVRMVRDDCFVAGGSSGALELWSKSKKTPLCRIKHAHGICPENNEPYWITALAAIPNSDVIASGSFDGYLRIWKIANKELQSRVVISWVGFVNTLDFTADSRHLIIGSGKEHRLGRWWSPTNGHNSVVVVPLIFKADVQPIR